MKTISSLVAIAFLYVATSALAHDPEQLGQFKGEHLGLFYSDHAISGHVKGRLVFATPLDTEFGIRVTHRANEKNVESVFKKEGKSLSGKIGKTEFALSRVSAKDGIIEGTLDKQPFKVVITSKTMEGNHYVNPLYDVQLKDRSYSFSLENGKACIGCSTKIVFVVLGMLRETGAL